MNPEQALTIEYKQLKRDDVNLVGGKNASLGELISQLDAKHIKVPDGFATTALAFRDFLAYNKLDSLIEETLDQYHQQTLSLSETGSRIRRGFIQGDWPEATARAIVQSYQQLGEKLGLDKPSVAVRSSATAEDLPEASFAGQQESYLNISGEQALLEACKRCYASLYTDRAISYRETQGFEHIKVALSVGVQQMVRSDLAGSGVMFSIDPETGFDKVVVINAVWGLGETLVQGSVVPDEHQVYKPLLARGNLSPIIERKLGNKISKMIYGNAGGESTITVGSASEEQNSFVLNDEDVLTLARWACIIEDHYGLPMDMEWAKDGLTQALYLVQARPETVHSQKTQSLFKNYKIKGTPQKILSGLAIGEAVVSGEVCLIPSITEIDSFRPGSILVTETTNPDWVPVMKQAKAIVTNHGGRTSHAAIVSRELGVPAVLGSGNATHLLEDGQIVSISCVEGDTGYIYEGEVEVETSEVDIQELGDTKTKIMLNMANPGSAMKWWRLPADGIGLVRMEFLINNHIKIHPLALLYPDKVTDKETRGQIEHLTRRFTDKSEFFVEKLATGLAKIAALYYPKPAIVRMSDFKTNEYANLIGGTPFEPEEENPMLGFRGASRYYSPYYKEGFALECKAIKRLREDMGFDNVIIMIPFCRTLEEADQVLVTMKEHGLERGKNGLQVYMMCEIPANVVLAEAFAKRFDGFSIGSNDLTQLTLGVDRDSSELAPLFSEQDAAVRWMISHAIRGAHASGAKVGLCGQAPSDHPEFADFLVDQGIDSMSVSPDSFFKVKTQVLSSEQRHKDSN